MKRVLTIMGPTACGKTETAMMLADRLPRVDLISVDSAMVYRDLDIGTAKPTAGELARYPHALVDVADPSEVFSAARFVESADHRVRDSLDGGRLPVLVGGTMLYFNAFRSGLNALPSADAGTRESIALRGEQEGWPALHRELERIDPQAAAGIEPQNRQRIQRALEVFELTGRPISTFWNEDRAGFADRFDASLVETAIVPADRALLHRRIAERIERMLEQGLVDEVRALRERRDLSLDCPAMRAVGYRQVWQYLDGQYDEAEMVDRLNAATRQLAKKQLTWLRRWQGAHVFSTPQEMFEWIVEELEGD